MKSYKTDDTIFALATAWATSAIAVIRVSGDGCISQIKKVFSNPVRLINANSKTLVHGWLKNFDKEDIDEVVIAVYKNGEGYTGEEAVEISCHGSLSIIKEIQALLLKIGFRQAEGGEFTLRAFLHGKLDLTQSEAVNELIKAEGRRGKALALNRLEGGLSKKINEIKDSVLNIVSTIEVHLDYAEDELDVEPDVPLEKINAAIISLKELADSYNSCRLFSNGAKVVLAGNANAGKSSLFNLLLKQNRSIVSSIEGTTRDYIESRCTIGDLPVFLYDTAGLRDNSSDLIENEGIKRTQSLIDSADIIVYLADGVFPDNSENSVRLLSDSRCIKVWNKSDLAGDGPVDYISISVTTGQGIGKLLEEIQNKLNLNNEFSSENDVAVESERQYIAICKAKEALERAKNSVDSGLPLDLIAVDFEDALNQLGALTGEVTSDDILDKIFSGFCVGK